MALSVNCATKVIYVPKADLTLVSGSLYELDVDQFRKDLKDWEDGDIGMAMPDTHRHNTTVTLSGVNYARTFEIINGYTVEFENGNYSVRCKNANHNIADVKVVNSVSLIIGNAAGLITVETGVSGLTPAESAALELIKKILVNKQITDPNTGLMTVYDDDNATVLVSGNVYEDVAASQPYRGQGIDRREKLEQGN